jgi:hypothetical protein
MFESTIAVVLWMWIIFYFCKLTIVPFYFCRWANFKQKFAVFNFLIQTVEGVLEVSVTGCAKELQSFDYIGYGGKRAFGDLKSTW